MHHGAEIALLGDLYVRRAAFYRQDPQALPGDSTWWPAFVSAAFANPILRPPARQR